MQITELYLFGNRRSALDMTADGFTELGRVNLPESAVKDDIISLHGNYYAIAKFVPDSETTSDPDFDTSEEEAPPAAYVYEVNLHPVDTTE